MPMFITDPYVERKVREERRASGADKYDEVWDGLYVIVPPRDVEHKALLGKISASLSDVVRGSGLGRVFSGVNVSDRREGWEHNYREPDVAVFLNDTLAENCGTHWLGGPNLAIEIVSRHDRSREKFGFYASVTVEELLLIDRHPWQLELFQLRDGQLEAAGLASAENNQSLTTRTAPIAWRLVPAEPRPKIEMTHADGRRWVI